MRNTAMREISEWFLGGINKRKIATEAYENPAQ
jgi:hypothetical protein